MFGSLFRRNASQKLSALLLVFGFIWGLVLLRYTFQQPKRQNSAELREQILELSKRYVRALAEENQNAVDGPRGASMAGYADLKRTIAVLLDDILQRLWKLENRVDDMISSSLTNTTNNTSNNSAPSGGSKHISQQARTPDNSFLGFVVEEYFHKNHSTFLNKLSRTNKALVYGKLADYWKDKISFLDIVRKYAELHDTFQEDYEVFLPKYVINHGILSGHDLQLLFREVKVFVGLGFPYTGPAPLEATANGCIFLNVKFNPPKNRKNTQFFQGKPTFRKLSSQHPYAESYIEKPHVGIVDIDNLSLVEESLQQIMTQKVEPYLPYEFTCEGLLERLNAFNEKQDFCLQREIWPPICAFRVKVANPSQSCVEVCQKEQLICELAFFYHLNKVAELKRYKISCSASKKESDLYLPAYNPENQLCLLQSDYLLFSCAGSHEHYNRICPC